MPHGRSISFQFGSEFPDLTAAHRQQSEQVLSRSELRGNFTTFSLEIHPLSFRDPATSIPYFKLQNSTHQMPCQLAYDYAQLAGWSVVLPTNSQIGGPMSEPQVFKTESPNPHAASGRS